MQPCEFKVLRVRECGPVSEPMDTPEKAVAYWRANVPKADWYDPDKESLVVLAVNVRYRIFGHSLVTLGSLDTCFSTPREIFRPAILCAAYAIVLMHNHPTGDSSPSQADIDFTYDVIEAGSLLKIRILDHIIIGDRFSSLRELGYFDCKPPPPRCPRHARKKANPKRVKPAKSSKQIAISPRDETSTEST